jgi:predicted nucleotidyltransferase
MDEVIVRIVNELKKEVAARYSLVEMRVFGSTAGGDRRPESDIDVFLHLPRVDRGIEEELFDVAYELELKYDCLIDLIILIDEDLAGAGAKPFIYRSMMEEGIAV